MKVRFWGTRGSTPSSVSAQKVRDKVTAALKEARGLDLSAPGAVEAFVKDRLSFEHWGTYGTNTSCVEIDDAQPDTYVLCDAGSGLRDFSHTLQNEGRLKHPANFHIFFSHLHWDHIQGFPFFAPAFMPQHTIYLHACHADLEAAIRGQMSAPYFPIEFDTLPAKIHFEVRKPGGPFEIGGFTVRSIEQDHPGKSYGYRFERAGKVVVYSTDSEHKLDSSNGDYPFVSFFDGADVLIFDAQYTLIDATFSKANWGHSSNVMGVELAARAGVSHLVLFHAEPSSTDEALIAFEEATREYRDTLVGKKPAMHRSGEQAFHTCPTRVTQAYDGLEIEI
ncbi:MAG: MBL fold metallo-hydrolase [Opitutales bacterium]